MYYALFWSKIQLKLWVNRFKMKIFSERLKYERTQKGFSQQKMADMLKIPRGTYSHYELDNKDGREPPFEIVCQIAKIFDVPIDYLFGLID